MTVQHNWRKCCSCFGKSIFDQAGDLNSPSFFFRIINFDKHCSRSLYVAWILAFRILTYRSVVPNLFRVVTHILKKKNWRHIQNIQTTIKLLFKTSTKFYVINSKLRFGIIWRHTRRNSRHTNVSRHNGWEPLLQVYLRQFWCK